MIHPIIITADREIGTRDQIENNPFFKGIKPGQLIFLAADTRYYPFYHKHSVRKIEFQDIKIT